MVKANEILGLRLISLHNLHFYIQLMKKARQAIEEGRFSEFRTGFVSQYRSRGNEDLCGNEAQ
jgi:queuine tRNA-ribosyltransferase